MKKNKIVVAGGVSQSAIGLSDSLVEYGRDELAGTTVILTDIREDHLAIVHKFADQLTNSIGVDKKFEST